MSIADLIIRLKNGYHASKPSVEARYSGFAMAVLEKLKNLGFIEDYKVTDDKRAISVKLQYDEEHVSRFTDVEVVSRPGQRRYVGSQDLKPVLSGFGYSILSTPKGIMTNVEAKKANMGGELLFKIW